MRGVDHNSLLQEAGGDESDEVVGGEKVEGERQTVVRQQMFLVLERRPVEPMFSIDCES
jgi:hypothetical protein